MPKFKPFHEWTLEDAQSMLQEHSLEWQGQNQKYYDGDHWQEGAGWAGPMPTDSDQYTRKSLMEEIVRGFASSNRIKTMVDRLVNTCLGHEPNWGATVDRSLTEGEVPTEAENALITELNTIFLRYWERKEVLKLFKNVTQRGLTVDRSMSRFYIPPGLLDDQWRIPNLPTAIEEKVAKIADLIYPVSARYDEGILVQNPNTLTWASIQAFELEKDGDDEDLVDAAELVYLNEKGETVIRILIDAEDPVYSETTIPLKGNLTAYQMQGLRIISPQVVQNQRLFNLALTMEQRNVISGGFLETFITNAQVPGRYIEDRESPTGKRFVPAARDTGAGQTQYLIGVPIKNDAGQVVGYAPPGVSHREPVKVETFRDTQFDADFNMHFETHQLHALITTAQDISGESRVQSRADFQDDATELKGVIDAFGRWFFTTLMNWIAEFAGQPDRYKGIRIDFDSQVDLGPLTDGQVTSIISVYNAGLESKRGAMTALRNDDPDATLNEMALEREANVSVGVQQANQEDPIEPPVTQ